MFPRISIIALDIRFFRLDKESQSAMLDSDKNNLPLTFVQYGYFSRTQVDITDLLIDKQGGQEYDNKNC